MSNINIVVRKPDFNEFITSGNIKNFIMRKLSEAVVATGKPGDYHVPNGNWLKEIGKWSSTYRGIEVIPRGALLSGQDLLAHQFEFKDPVNLITTLGVIKSGAVSDVDIKIDDTSNLFDSFDTFDFDMGDLGRVATKVIYKILQDVYDKFTFSFKVGPNNNLPVRQLTDAIRQFRSEVNIQLRTYNKALSLLEPAVKLARLMFSTHEPITKFVVENDIEIYFDNSVLAQWFSRTNVALLGDRKDIKQIYSSDFHEKFIKDIKRLKHYQKHQELLVEVLNDIYSKYSATEFRSYFSVDTVEIGVGGTKLSNDKTTIVTPINTVQFVDLNLNSLTDQRVHGYSIFDEIPGTDLKLYGGTEDDLSSLVSLHDDVVQREIERFEICRSIAETNMHTNNIKEFNYEVTNFVSNSTLAATFGNVEEVEGKVLFSFESNFILDDVRLTDEMGSKSHYLTGDPDVVAKYVDYDSLIKSSKYFPIRLINTMPSPSRDISVNHSTYTVADFVDALDGKLSYFSEYRRLLRKPNNKLRQLEKFSDIKPDGSVELKDVGDLFRYLNIIYEMDTRLYALLDNTSIEQFNTKKSFFLNQLSSDDVKDRLVFTNYVNQVIGPVREWLKANAGYKILTSRALSVPIRLSNDYKLACFYLLNEILQIIGLGFTAKEIELIEPASLDTQIR